jgi:hypothetical protein
MRRVLFYFVKARSWIPSTKAFKNRAAVQLPAGLPLVYNNTQINIKEMRGISHSVGQSRFEGPILRRGACAKICHVLPHWLRGVHPIKRLRSM